jgi:hypothetical protein
MAIDEVRQCGGDPEPNHQSTLRWWPVHCILLFIGSEGRNEARGSRLFVLVSSFLQQAGGPAAAVYWAQTGHHQDSTFRSGLRVGENCKWCCRYLVILSRGIA